MTLLLRCHRPLNSFSFSQACSPVVISWGFRNLDRFMSKIAHRPSPIAHRQTLMERALATLTIDEEEDVVLNVGAAVQVEVPQYQYCMVVSAWIRDEVDDFGGDQRRDNLNPRFVGMQYSKFKDFRASFLGTTSSRKQILPGNGQPTRMELDRASLESGGGTSSLREEEPMPKVDDVQSLVAPVSDHDPLLLDTSPDSQHTVCHRFRFDNARLQDANLEAVVVAGWRCEGELWGRRRNRDRNMKRALVQKLLQERRDGTDGGDLDHLRAEWNLLLEEDEVRRRQ
ncbi:hypothetical protein K2173_000011 [Erythroxylum novogranatense]|uniref:Uncharacterized protein n=1 Tax=Erythroxylum novogranatense TaxID=1862640 RepID=A0AAV8SN70_9ROSI|nr:hypothetical protein K2173_000011 [Erythroxylum novogranatense]